MPLISLELAADAEQRRRRRDGEDEDEDVPAGMRLVTPGDVVTSESGFMRGHGTYMREDGELIASVAGIEQRTNKLISVTRPAPLKSKYQCEIGDVVVGRITEVQQRRWKVELNARLDAALLLSNVNLMGGELRRRSEQDELAMRKYLVEGDLISAEVQNLYNDGSCTLHTRSQKYGKLSQGTLVRVSPSLVKRSKTHFHHLPCGASVILGNNGFVWVSPTQHEEAAHAAGAAATGNNAAGGGFTQNLSQVSRADREVVSRVRNCILALADSGVELTDTSLINAFEVSAEYSLTDLLKKSVMRQVAEMTRQQSDMQT